MTTRSSRTLRLVAGALLVGLAGPFHAAPSVQARTSQNAAASDTLVVAYPGAPQSTDPSLAYDNTGAAVLRGIYESLVAMDGTSTTKVKGVLATSWSANAEQDGVDLPSAAWCPLSRWHTVQCRGGESEHRPYAGP